MAKGAKGKQRDTYLDYATIVVRQLYKGWPEMGGPDRKARFDALLRDVQKLQGKSAVGLRALDGPAAAEARAASRPTTRTSRLANRRAAAAGAPPRDASPASASLV
jgi:hypothetical protein